RNGQIGEMLHMNGKMVGTPDHLQKEEVDECVRERARRVDILDESPGLGAVGYEKALSYPYLLSANRVSRGESVAQNIENSALLKTGLVDVRLSMKEGWTRGCPKEDWTRVCPKDPGYGVGGARIAQTNQGRQIRVMETRTKKKQWMEEMATLLFMAAEPEATVQTSSACLFSCQESMGKPGVGVSGDVAVTVAFIICWAPFHTQRLMVLYVQKWTPELLAVQSHIFYISGVLYFVSSTVNPILYNVISRRYRVAFKETIFGPCSRFGSSGERPRVGSNTMNRNLTNYGDSNFNHFSQQQHHGLLIRDSPASSLRRSHARSMRYDVSDRRGCTSKKADVISQGSCDLTREERMLTTLCPDILNCKKTAAAGGGKEKESEEAPLKQTEPLLSDVNALCPENECSEHLIASVDNCKHSSKGIVNPAGRSANFISDITIHDVSLSDNTNTKGKKVTGPLTRCLLGDAGTRFPVTSHQDGVEDATGRQKNASLCKQCLTHSTSGNAPHNGTVAYHVKFDVSQPRTVV
ncbi:hypothetical protein BaRGS_00015652, partial [Batillaria attramentaria]